jgi:hypothetical protein
VVTDPGIVQQLIRKQGRFLVKQVATGTIGLAREQAESGLLFRGHCLFLPTVSMEMGLPSKAAEI